MSPTFAAEQASAANERLGAGAAEIDWYHTQELAPGLVTPGMFDLRPYVERYGLPASMEGMRVLDVGTFEGFWAFEMERRGARGRRPRHRRRPGPRLAAATAPGGGRQARRGLRDGACRARQLGRADRDADLRRDAGRAGFAST